MNYVGIKSVMLLPVIALFLASCAGSKADLASNVDPMVGSGGHGHVFVGADVPFGMVQLGPTQITQGWDWCSGYAYRDTIVIGFSHTRLSGTGIGDLGDIMFMPFDPAKKQYTPEVPDGNAGASPRHLYARLNHDLERAEPGFYSLQMPDIGVNVRLTAGTYTGYHEYTFLSDESAVLVDLCTGVGWDAVTDWNLEQVDDRTIKGWRRSTGWAKDQIVYFYAMFSQPFTFGEDEVITAGPTKSAGKPSAAKVLLFDTGKHKKIFAVVGISPTSEQKALENIAADARKGNDFEKNVAWAREQWNDALGKIKIKGMDETQTKIFYTALYHTMIAPARFSDASDPARYTVFSLWDAYRAAFPLYTVIDPERAAAFGDSFMDIYDKQGDLPVWHLWGNETDCMPGNAGVTIMGDLVVKGLYKDAGRALSAMVASSHTRERGQQDILDYGFIPYDGTEPRETVSEALEFAVSYGSVADVAELVGDGRVLAEFKEKAHMYAKYLDPATGFSRATAKDGSYRTPFDPFRAEHMKDDYTEGNAWQYTFMVPHDVDGLIDCFGGPERFLQKLDSLFIAQGDMGSAHSDVTGLIGQYAHGNEPCHHVAYMYDYAGRPDKCQKIVREVMDSLYFLGPDGLCGNEDVGQMSAWYVLSALGLYQVDPCGGEFRLGSPAVMEATINDNFKIIAHNNSKTNIYVASVRLNGKALEKPCISYKDIMAGGILEFEMTNTPRL